MSPANGRPLPPPAPSMLSAQGEGAEGRSTGVRARTEGDAATTAAPSASTSISPSGAGAAAQSASTSPSGAPLVNASPVISEVVGTVPLAEGIRNNSIPPEALRKPYASLSPQPKRSQTATSRAATGRPQLESFPGIDEELTGTGPASPGQVSPSTKSSRAICKKHKIAKGKNGECMLCRKEEAARATGLGWKLMVAFIVLAVLVSAAIAGYVHLKHL